MAGLNYLTWGNTLKTNTFHNRLRLAGRAWLLGLPLLLGQAQATVVAASYDGIYQWSAGQYLSLHQDGTHLIATIYFNKNGSFTFPASTGGVLPVTQIDVFDLMDGQVSGSTAKMTGTRFHRACQVSYNFVFNSDTTVTVTRTGASNTPAADAAGISCSALAGTEASTLVVPKIRFN